MTMLKKLITALTAVGMAAALGTTAQASPDAHDEQTADSDEAELAQTEIETETVSETETKHGAEYEETTTLSDPITGVTYEESVTVEENNWIRTPMGMSVNVGGGVYGFVDDAARDFTSTGGSWDFRTVVGTRNAIALEAAYVGTAQDIDALGLDSSSVLLGSQFEAAGRINILQVNAWQPYVVAGLGYGYFDIVNSDFNTSNVKNNDNIGYVPLAAGVSYRMNGFVLDARAAYRAAWSDSMIQATANSEEADMDSWNVSAQLGWEF